MLTAQWIESISNMGEMGKSRKAKPQCEAADISQEASTEITGTNSICDLNSDQLGPTGFSRFIHFVGYAVPRQERFSKNTLIGQLHSVTKRMGRRRLFEPADWTIACRLIFQLVIKWHC